MHPTLPAKHTYGMPAQSDIIMSNRDFVHKKTARVATMLLVIQVQACVALWRR